MPILAAIDVGSNAMRLAVASVDADRRIALLEIIREPVRLGQDVFTSGLIEERTIDNTTEAFRRFRETMNRHGVRLTKAVATSAMREAMNREILLDRIAQVSGIEIDVIGPEEEARLIHLAVSEKLVLKNRIALLVDIGGGSTEITLASDGSILSTESYQMGSVRLLRTLGNQVRGEGHVHQLIQEYVDATQKRIRREIGDRRIDVCAGTGGNLESLGDLRREVLGKDKDTVLLAPELDQLVHTLLGMTFQQRMQELRLRPDRADVIVPAALIIQKILQIAGVPEVAIPRVGLKDGLLLDMTEELYGDRKRLRRDQVIPLTMQIGRKYQFDEPHAVSVARFATQLFDETRFLHNLGTDERLFLEAAALLHDIGGYIAATDHHKHTQYLLHATPIIGLSEKQMAIVANVARYHRKSMPKPQHEFYRALSARDRVMVSKLAALLRLADALDTEHASKVTSIEVEYRKPRFSLRLHGEGDLLLEKWALVRKGQMFEEVYSVKLAIEE
jgi:exopolyphosphatase/guanosine-5'-triphosphate,3'-diphosphate pyrophosphatase